MTQGNRIGTEDGLRRMLGRTFVSVDVDPDREYMTFTTFDGEAFTFYHSQDCCEYVWLEDITGDIGDLCGTPLLMADEVTNDDCTWTFYKFATIKGSVDLRWCSESNGFYSTSVDMMHKPAEVAS